MGRMWLNASDKKMVVAPARWFADPDKDDRDIIPETWIPARSEITVQRPRSMTTCVSRVVAVSHADMLILSTFVESC